MRRFTFSFMLLLCFSFLAEAQLIKSRWKAYRYEVNFGLGASNFLGELGGANQVGTNYFRDLEFSQTRFASNLGIRYKITPHLTIHPQITYGKVSGDDKLTTEFFRSYRNLSFKSNIWEFATNLELSVTREQVGHRYRLKRVRGQRGYELNTYFFAGVALFTFNPKAEIEGEWYELQPLGTEGQGIVPTRKKYSLVQFAIPVGIGFKYAFNSRWGLGLNYGLRKTFTDYVDDVSKTYYDNNIIASQNGYIAAALADRSNHTYPYITAPGAQRGDPTDKDSYMFAIFSINYKLRTGRTNFPLF